MPLSISLNIPCDATSLAVAAELIRALRDIYPDSPPEAPAGVVNGPNLPPQPPLATTRNPEDYVEAWLDHLGPASRKFWRIAAEYFTPDRPWLTFEDLEAASQIPKASLRSYHRNS